MFLHVSVILFTGGWPADTAPPFRQADTPSPRAATAANGTHPTGMHSCFALIYPQLFLIQNSLTLLQSVKFPRLENLISLFQILVFPVSERTQTGVHINYNVTATGTKMKW